MRKRIFALAVAFVLTLSAAPVSAGSVSLYDRLAQLPELNAAAELKGKPAIVVFSSYDCYAYVPLYLAEIIAENGFDVNLVYVETSAEGVLDVSELAKRFDSGGIWESLTSMTVLFNGSKLMWALLRENGGYSGGSVHYPVIAAVDGGGNCLFTESGERENFYFRDSGFPTPVNFNAERMVEIIKLTSPSIINAPEKDGSSSANGARLGDVLYTDIKAYINGNAIPSYSIEGSIYVIAADLRNYGFNVVYDNGRRTSTITYDRGKAVTPINVSANSGKVGAPAFAYYGTDIRAVINGAAIEGRAVNGSVAIPFSALKAFGNYTYDNNSRTCRLVIRG